MTQCQRVNVGRWTDAFPVFQRRLWWRVFCNICWSLFCIAHWGQSDILQHTKLKKHKLAIWSKILSQKAASFLTTRKGEEGIMLQKVCLHSTWSNSPSFWWMNCVCTS